MCWFFPLFCPEIRVKTHNTIFCCFLLLLFRPLVVLPVNTHSDSVWQKAVCVCLFVGVVGPACLLATKVFHHKDKKNPKTISESLWVSNQLQMSSVPRCWRTLKPREPLKPLNPQWPSQRLKTTSVETLQKCFLLTSTVPVKSDSSAGLSGVSRWVTTSSALPPWARCRLGGGRASEAPAGPTRASPSAGGCKQ